MGRRTAKIRNGETTVYHWQEDTLAIESTNGQNTHYLFEPGTFEPLAQFQTTSPIGIEREDKPAEPYSYDPETDPLLKIPPEPKGQSEAQPELVYYQLDHLGTPIAAHNAKGEAVWTAEYEAWGRIRQETVSDGLKANIPFRFQGQYYDEESGLHYNRFRYYDPEIGRFVSQDPIGLKGGENLYAYVNNPNQWVDILGLSKRKGAAAKDCSSECQLRDHCGSGSGQKPWSMRYEENSGKHKKNGYWLGKNWVAPKPTNGNLSLKTSIPFREKGRIGYDAVNNEVIQFNRHRVDESNCVEYWHGFVINNQPVPMKEEAKKIAKTLGYKGKK